MHQRAGVAHCHAFRSAAARQQGEHGLGKTLRAQSLGELFLVGAAVSVFLGVYGRVHDPTGETVATLFLEDQITMKAWFATVAALCAVVQVGSALRLYGKVGSGPTPGWLGDVHRLSGTLAFLFTLPVAYHCLWSIGFSSDPGFNRVFVHSVAGRTSGGSIAYRASASCENSSPGSIGGGGTS